MGHYFSATENFSQNMLPMEYMHSESFHVTFKRFNDILSSNLEEIHKHMKFADVTFVSDDNIHVKAHKAVLSANSPILANLFLSHSDHQQVVVMEGIRCQDLRVVLELMYGGRANVSDDSVDNIKHILKVFEMKEIIYDNFPLNCVNLDTEEEEIETNPKNENIAANQESFTKKCLKKCKDNSFERREFDTMVDIATGSSNVKCTDCGKCYRYMRGLNQHIKAKHGEIKYVCDQCDYKATRKSSLIIHKQTTHEGQFGMNEIIYDNPESINSSLPKCENFNIEEQEIEAKPKNDHIGANQESFSEECQKKCKDTSFENRKSDRMVEVATGTKNVKCTDCGKCYKQRRELNRHIKEKHEGIKYPCDQCDYKATQNGSLKIHKQSTHEGHRYFCSECDYNNGQLNNVTRHHRYKHEGLRYPCDQCDYQATTNGSLKQHIKIVHENLSFVCPHCDVHTRCKRDLSKHVMDCVNQ